MTVPRWSGAQRSSRRARRSARTRPFPRPRTHRRELAPGWRATGSDSPETSDSSDRGLGRDEQWQPAESALGTHLLVVPIAELATMTSADLGHPPGRFVLGQPAGDVDPAGAARCVSVAALSVALPHHGGMVCRHRGKPHGGPVVDPVQSVVRVACEGSDDEGSSGSGCAMSAGRCWCDGARPSCRARPDHVSP